MRAEFGKVQPDVPHKWYGFEVSWKKIPRLPLKPRPREAFRECRIQIPR